MRPIFIAGCDRSGTTLLASLLGNHPDCIAIPETHFFTDALAKLSSKEFEAEKFWDTIRNHWRFKIWNLPVDSSLEKKVINSASAVDIMEALVEAYAKNNNIEVSKYWIDHTPSNMGYCDTLLQLFPESKFIHLVRDGRAVCNSVLPLDWGPETVVNAAEWWNKKVAYGLAAESKYPQKVTRVHYETLVRQTSETVEDIIDFLGLENKITLSTDGFNKPEYTKAQHTLVGKDVSEERTIAWKKEMSNRNIETFEYSTSELLLYLGYTMDYGINARPPKTPSIWEKIQLKLRARRKKKARKKRIKNSIKEQN